LNANYETVIGKAGIVPDAKTGPKGAKVIATDVVEKGKPLATPAPNIFASAAIHFDSLFAAMRTQRNSAHALRRS